MKRLLILNLFILFIMGLSCKKDEAKSERFNLLTSHTWTADSLLANGIDESEGRLKRFKGDTKFNEDGSGYVGEISGTWEFADQESAIIIISDSLPIPVTTFIEELSETSLKITTSYPEPGPPAILLQVRMTFKPK